MSLPSEILYHFLSGGTAIASWVVALFFYRIWIKTRDTFFSIFALAFFVLGMERVVLTLYAIPSEQSPWIYLIRLTCFLLIIAAIIEKNKR